MIVHFKVALVIGWIILILMIIICFSDCAFAATSSDQSTTYLAKPVQQALQAMNTTGIDQAWNRLQSQYGSYLPENGGELVSQVIKGDATFSLQGVVQGLLRFFMDTVFANLRLLGMLIVLSVIAFTLDNVKSAFEEQTVSLIGQFVISLALIILAISSFHQATSFATSAIQAMTDLMYASLPIVLSLVMATGGLTSAATLHPIVFLTVNTISFIVLHFAFPLLFASAVLLMTSHLSGRLHVSGLADLMKTIVITTLGLSMTAFLGVMTLQGSLASLRDGVTLKSVKFIASNLVPVVGKALSDATTSIAGGLLLVKNATGIISAVVLLLICAFPSLKILALSLVYRLAGTLLQPVGDSPVIATLSTISKTLTLLFAVTAVVGLMFFFSMIITVWITNTTAMVR